MIEQDPYSISVSFGEVRVSAAGEFDAEWFEDCDDPQPYGTGMKYAGYNLISYTAEEVVITYKEQKMRVQMTGLDNSRSALLAILEQVFGMNPETADNEISSAIEEVAMEEHK